MDVSIMYNNTPGFVASIFFQLTIFNYVFFLMWAKIVEVTWRQYDKVKVRSSAALPAICASACVRIKKAPQ